MTAIISFSETHSPGNGLAVAHAEDGDEVVVRVHGELEMSTATLARDRFDRALATGCKRVVVDLRALEFLDSTGINALVQLHQGCLAAKSSLKLLLAPGPVRRTLEVSGVLGMIEHDTAHASAA